MNEQNKNIILGIVVVVLVIGGVYYARTKKAMAPERIEENGQELPILNEDSNFINNENENILIDQGVNNETIDNKPSTVEENKLKFNTAMKNSSDAFLAGNYSSALAYYNEALKYNDSDVVYIRIFSVYNIQGEIEKAKASIDKAIEKNPSYTDYWNTKIQFLDEKTSISFVELKAIYTAGLAKVDSRTKINLVTIFARVAESNNENGEAIALWEYAKQLYPANTSIYQAEIDRLKTSL